MDNVTNSEVVAGAGQRAVAEADRLHVLGYNCAESVFGGVTAAFGEHQVPLKIATGFGGGIGRTGEVCGAVTGGVMAMGWLKGRVRPDDKEGYAELAAQVRKFLARFRDEFGTLDCGPLTGYDLSDPAILPKFSDDPDRRVKCANFVKVAARMAAEALAAWPKG